jgi:hypothetical protein
MTTPTHPDDDPLAARLSDALHTEADMVQPSDDGLQQIRSGIEASRRPWWRHPAAIAVAAAAVLGVAVGGTAVLLGDDESGTVAADRTTEPATTAASTPPGSTSTGPSTSPVPVEGDVYVYYVMDDGQAPRLYREQHPNPGAAPVVAALSVMFGGSPDDPDYSSPWPEGTEVLGVDVAGDTATVDVSDFVSVGAEAETIAVQQVVYTVTANDNAVQQVRLLVDGKAPQSGHSDWSDPVSREPMVDVQGFIWLLTPTEGATVSSPVEITGFGTAFEGTVSWEVRRDGSDEVLAEGFTQAGANGEFDEFTDTVDLDPGVYEIRAFESSAEDGRPLHVDTKVFTVE